MAASRAWSARPTALWLATLLAIGPAAGVAQSFPDDATDELVSYAIKPSDTDSAIRHYDEPHQIVFRRGTGPQAELAVFMPGTDGKPANARRLLGVIAGQGYRVIGLEYDDTPAVVEVCPRNPSPTCSGEFRRKRIYGDGKSAVVDIPPAESIVNRLVRVLEYLERQHPGEGWGGYLSNGAPDWSRIVVSGLSQGAGMAAYIAKHEAVARVVLFSSPWDYQAPLRSLAPWIAEPGATPPERWFAEYHQRERTASLIRQAYEMLRIPPANIRVFDLPAGAAAHGNNPFHGSTIRVPEYAPQWRFLFGESP